MATLKLGINKHYPDKKGRVSVRLEIGAKSKMTTIATGVSIFPANWDESTQTILLAEPRAKLKNKIISERYDEAEKRIADFLAKGRLPNNALKIRDILLNKETEITFLEYFLKTKNKKSGNTLISYTSTYNIIDRYSKKKLFFEDITPSWLETFGSNYLKKNSVNALAVHLRNIRSILNSAINEKVISADLYPFRSYKIKTNQTAHRNLTLETFRKIFEYDNPELNWARDVFLLSFHLIGMNMKDIFNLAEIDDERINYNRAKTKRLYQIKIQPETDEIISRLRGEDTCFAFQKQFSDYKTFTKGVNSRLKQIAEDLKIKPFTTYHARHSWATFASDLDISEKTIKMALGHGTRTVTDIYVNFNIKKIDNANRLVIDHISNKKNEKPILEKQSS